jgi:hypothetical protein
VDEREIRPGGHTVDMDGHLWRVLRLGADTRRGCPECDSDGEASERHPQADGTENLGLGGRGESGEKRVSRRKRWGIGVAIFLSAYVVGYLVSRDPSMGHLGGAIALVAMAVLSWLAPVMLKSSRPPRSGRRSGTRGASSGRRSAWRR